MVESRRKILFPNVTDEEWNDWHWQVKNRIETLEDLKKYIELTPEEEEGVKACLGTLRMAITPYYLSLIQPGDPHDPVRLQAIPTAKELHQADSDLLDPLHEDEDSPAPGLTHRYPDRCLLLITDQCSMYCRHCTRRRFAGQHDAGLPVDQVDQAIEYIRNTPQIRDVLLSGGDALLVSDERLEYIIAKLREIPHVEIVRIGSRTPRGAASAHHSRAVQHAEEVSPHLAEHPLQPPQRDHPRVRQGLCHAGRRRYPAGQPERAAGRHQ